MKAIVSRLVSIEELASMDVLCSDKTGTLTKNTLSLGPPITFGQHTAREVLLAGALASRAVEGDAIDQAVRAAVADDGDVAGFRVVTFEPFDPVHKRSSAEIQDGSGNRFSVTKGAPQVILDLTRPDAWFRAEALARVDELAKKGSRAIAVARKDGGGEFQLLEHRTG